MHCTPNKVDAEATIRIDRQAISFEQGRANDAPIRYLCISKFATPTLSYFSQHSTDINKHRRLSTRYHQLRGLQQAHNPQLHGQCSDTYQAALGHKAHVYELYTDSSNSILTRFSDTN